MGDWLFHFLDSYEESRRKFLCHFYDICFLLIALDTYGEPTLGNYYMHDVVSPKGSLFGSSWQTHSGFSCPIPSFFKGQCGSSGFYFFGC